MANIKQQIKRVRTDEKAKLANASFKSGMKSALKAVLTATDKETATKLLPTAYKKLDKAQAKGLVHKNFVSRNKAKLASYVNTL